MQEEREVFIYSRKSKWTGRGESIENQIQMCQEYIAQKLPKIDSKKIHVFEDEGYSGKNTKRPEFQQMLQQIRNGKCCCLICYKLDRLGRNLIDLAELVEELNKLQVSFISIRENFDTSTPLGKTMLYIAGIFAQMEREQIAERVKDNMLLLARDGRWLGGNTPLGFSSKKEIRTAAGEKVKSSYCLQIEEAEMTVVRFVFQKYEETQALGKVTEYFLQNDIRTKRGREYTNLAVKDLLTNPVYCTADLDAYDYYKELGCQLCFDREQAEGVHGLIAYARTSSSVYVNKNNPPEEWVIAIGRHPGVISGKQFVKIQRSIEANSKKGSVYRRFRNETALLSGLLYCSCGHAMRPKYYHAAQKTEGGERKFSYLCPYKERTHGEKCQMPNLPGNALDQIVTENLLSEMQPTAEAIKKIFDDKKMEWKEFQSSAEMDQQMIRQMIEEKQQQMKRLVRTLAQAEHSIEFVEQVEKEVAQLRRECQELQKRLETADWERIKEESESQERFGEMLVKKEEADMRELAEQCQSCWKLFQTLSTSQKKECLRRLIDHILWDGEKISVFRKVIG